MIGDSQHGFTESKLCVTNLVASYDEVTAVVDEERATNAICLNLCKAFDNILHNILVSKLETRGFSDGTVVG